MGTHYVYFDSGTSNSRAYLVDADLNLITVEKAAVGSKDSAIAGSNKVLIEGLFSLYSQVLSANGLSDADIIDIYSSGMVTSPYGLFEIPHLPVPISTEGLAQKVHPFVEETLFHRTINLIPGLKTINEDFAYVNNVRGEEIEIVGLMDTLHDLLGGRSAAIIMPGSHTHAMLVQGSEIRGILSNFTGELFHALKQSTIIAPVLSAPIDSFDPEMIRLGVRNLKKFGFSRAIYIGHAMRLFSQGDARARRSYCEGVISGGVCLSLGEYCRTVWSGCETAVIAADAKMIEAYSAVLAECPEIKDVHAVPLSSTQSYALQGFRKIARLRGV